MTSEHLHFYELLAHSVVTDIFINSLQYKAVMYMKVESYMKPNIF